MTTEERKAKVAEWVDAAITKLRKIRRLAVHGDAVPEYDFPELNEIISSVKHNVEMLNKELGR